MNGGSGGSGSSSTTGGGSGDGFAPGGGGGGSRGTGSGTGIGTGGGGGGTRTSGPVAPGVTAKTIFVGAQYSKNQDAAYAAAGVSAVGSADARDYYKVAIEDLNERGGIAGREVVPIYFGYDVTSSETADQQHQTACAKWTQDNEVFVILTGSPVIRECAKKAGIVAVSAYPAGSVPETFRQYPRYVETNSVNLIRIGPVTVDGLAREGYFTKGARIGIVTWDDPAYRESIQKGFLPAFQRHGLKLGTPPRYVSPPQNYADIPATSADINSAILQFSTLGIDHVLIAEGSAGFCGIGCMTVLFLQQAKSQQYYPRYGLNDNNDPVGGLEAGVYPADQLRRSVAVSWIDSSQSRDAGWKTNRSRERCFALMRKHGVAVDSVTAREVALEACEGVWFLEAAVARMGDVSLTTGNFMSGVDSLGYDFASPSAYIAHFSPTQHDGIAGARNMRFVDGCSCYRYATVPYRT